MSGSGPTARRDGVVAALAAATLFGVGTPIAKLLLPSSDPIALAGLLYGGAGLGLAAVALVRRVRDGASREAALRRGDAPLLAAIVASGGVVAPVLLLVGLAYLPAADASLLLNLEAPLTVLLAVALFGEHLGAQAAIGTALILLGAAALGGARSLPGHGLGATLVALACLGWAVDNNLTQRVSLRDPIAVAGVKTGVAGAINLSLAALAGRRLPGPDGIAGAVVLGSVSYGLSLALAVRAMRSLGAARQAALFAVAPFVGALASVPLLGERVDIKGAAVMAAGVALLVRERHAHEHAHEPLEHDHLHVHDAHHDHEHPDAVDPRTPHSHPHRHDAIVHAHPHVSDPHHRHRH